MGEFLFDLYELFVVNMFGSIVVAILAIVAVIAIIFLVCRVRPGFMVIWLLFYFIAMAAMTLGGLALFFGFIITATALVWQVIGWFADRKQV